MRILSTSSLSCSTFFGFLFLFRHASMYASSRCELIMRLRNPMCVGCTAYFNLYLRTGSDDTDNYPYAKLSNVAGIECGDFQLNDSPGLAAHTY